MVVHASDSIIISGNEVRNVGLGGNIYMDAIEVENGASGVEVSANLIDGAPGNAVSFCSVQLDGVTVRGSQVQPVQPRVPDHAEDIGQRCVLDGSDAPPDPYVRRG